VCLGYSYHPGGKILLAFLLSAFGSATLKDIRPEAEDQLKEEIGRSVIVVRTLTTA
jgi:hypothetical protein